MHAKLDGAGHYDDFEVDRVLAVDINPNAKQTELLPDLAHGILNAILDVFSAHTAMSNQALNSAKVAGPEGRPPRPSSTLCGIAREGPRRIIAQSLSTEWIRR
jgi:hypothetical protein